MAQVFVCHASEDKPTAEAVVAMLESAGVTCWIAPRDVPPGTDYAQAIMNGIGSSDMLLLVLSRASNESQHVRREVERGVARDLLILPVRIEDVTPSRSLEYFISDAQWFDAFPGDLTTYSTRLVSTVRQRLALGETVVARKQAETAAPPPDLGPVAAALRALVERFGPELGDDPRRVAALLRDLVGTRRAEIAAVVAAAEEGVPEALRSSSEATRGALVQRLTENLERDRALATAAAAQAVVSWAAALGVALRDETPPAGERPPETPATPAPERQQPVPPSEAKPPARPPGKTPELSRYLPVIGIAAVAAVIGLVVVLSGNGSGTADGTTSTIESTTSTTEEQTTTSSTTEPTTTTLDDGTETLTLEPVEHSSGRLATVAPADWGLVECCGEGTEPIDPAVEAHIYSAEDVDAWVAEYNANGWKTEARTSGFRLSMFADDRASDLFMQQILDASEVPDNCNFDVQESREVAAATGSYRWWANIHSCDGGATYELYALYEPALPSYFVVFEAYFENDAELDALIEAFGSASWIRP